eukprot:TRINITY_DN135012_c3_g1_i1.p1 TRINITY_DN135012_c3_g1~~TRINITY_DN135012_c3_g1_i1.p1  ORF type:complete len:927 (+),score=69.32 TRINITY_DN135012_c3_g1_i1:4744-7524(+)
MRMFVHYTLMYCDSKRIWCDIVQYHIIKKGPDIMSSIKLRELIRQVRACKTAAEERAVITKECALIRNNFKVFFADLDPQQDEITEYRARNIAKLIFMNLLGYSTTFAQIECLKLVASPKFTDKKIGYLGLTQLLNEDSEVLMMVNNSIKKDLAESQVSLRGRKKLQGQFIVSLALTALCEISTSEMCREMYQEIQKLTTTSNHFIKKKATLAAVRIIRKVPDMVDEFAKLVENLLQERNHGVQLATFALMREILQIEPAYRKKFRRLVGVIVKAHKSLLSGGYTPDYDISGIMDPFLQVSILHVLRMLGEESPDASEEMFDLLTQIASNADSGKTTANAILYECARTIVTVESSPALKVMGINILGKFLSHKDSNTRYISLNLLKKVVQLDYDAVQRHKATILDCVKENDISIRKGALDLLSKLVNKMNVKSIVKELLNILIVAEPDFQGDLAATICWAVEQYSPSIRWQIDTTIKVLTLAGSYVKDEHIYTLIHLITAAPDQHAYSVHSTYLGLRENLKQEGLVLFGMWMIGEFGQFLVKPYTDTTLTAQAVGADEILRLIEDILNNPKTPTKIRDYALTALIKLSIKLPAESLSQINTLIVSQMNWPVSEVQQRSMEYAALMDSKFQEKRRRILEAIPLSKRAEMLVKGKVDRDETAEGGLSPPRAAAAVKEEMRKEKTGLEYLLDIPQDTPQEKKENVTNTLNILEDVFAGIGGEPGSIPAVQQPSLLPDFGEAPAQSPAPATTPPADVILLPLQLQFLNLFPGETVAPAAPVEIPKTRVEGYTDNCIRVDFEMDPKDPAKGTERHIVAYFTNLSGEDITGLNMQVAVPKHMKISLQPATGSTLYGNGSNSVQQEMKITNPLEGTKPISIRIKIGYNCKGQNAGATKTVSFPLNAQLTRSILFIEVTDNNNIYVYSMQSIQL